MELLKRGFGDPRRERITEAVRNKYYTEYFKRFAEKWHRNDHLIHRQLEKITNFSKEEIQLLQTEFLKLLKKKKRKQKNLPEINGITKDDFISIMNTVFQSSHLSKRVLINEGGRNKEEGGGGEGVGEEGRVGGGEGGGGVGGRELGEEEEGGTREENRRREEEDYSKIFDIFDDDKSGSLDFREFLCGMSLLMRGKIAEKIELCFYLFDKENRGFLEFQEFETMMDLFIKSVKVTLPPDRCKLLEQGSALEEVENDEGGRIKEGGGGKKEEEGSEEEERRKEVVGQRREEGKGGRREEEEGKKREKEEGRREEEGKKEAEKENRSGEKGFRRRMKENFGKKEKLFLSDLLILQKDEFIQELTRAYGGALRKGNTTMEIGASLDKVD